jgi:4-amino-4-deoxy-L-arabinose transferase-like glycosyltransferase
MRLNRLFTGHWMIILLLATALAVRLVVFQPQQVYWDEAVYIGMGKYIFSGGTAGLWEPIRPVLLPILLGLGWSLKLNPLLVGRISLFMASLGVIFLIYDIQLKLFSRRSAIIAALLFSFSAIFFQLGFHVLTDIPATLLLLLAVSQLIRKRFALAGLFYGLSVLTKFSMLLFAVGLVAYLAYLRKDRTASSAWFGLGAAIPLAPFLVVNCIAYGSPILPFVEASRIIRQVIGCNYHYFRPWYFYFAMIVRENVVYLLAPLGFYAAQKQANARRMLALLLVVPLLYFTQLHCRDYRYLATFLPFVAMFASLGLERLTARLSGRVFKVFLLILLVLSASLGISYYYRYEPRSAQPVPDFFTFPENRSPTGEVWISNPLVTLHTDQRLRLLYYPVYNAELSVSINQEIEGNVDSIKFVFIDNCGGGLICPPGDSICMQEKGRLKEILASNFQLVFLDSYDLCQYEIYSTT